MHTLSFFQPITADTTPILSLTIRLATLQDGQPPRPPTLASVNGRRANVEAGEARALDDDEDDIRSEILTNIQAMLPNHEHRLLSIEVSTFSSNLPLYKT